MVQELRAIDEKIAKMRGWERYTYYSTYAWEPKPGTADYHRGSADPEDRNWFGFWDDPPPFTGDWSLAGVLLEDMCGDVRRRSEPGERSCWVSSPVSYAFGDMVFGFGETPCEAIARAWLAWKEKP